MDRIKFYAKLASTSLLRWLALAGFGFILSLIGIVVGLVLFGNNAGAGYHGGGTGSLVGALIGVATLFQDELWTAVLLTASFAFIAIYLLLANKIALSFVLFHFCENKLCPWVGDKVSALLSSIIDKQPGWLNSIKSVAALRNKLFESANADSALNRIQRKVVCYGLKRANLEDLDFQQQNLNLPALVSSKVVQSLQESARPTYMPFWWAVSAHATLLVLALVFDHH